MDLRTVAKRRTVRLTTRGRKSGQLRTVKIWFVTADQESIYVQHVSRGAANWYRNLLRTPSVTLDFGDGPLAAHAVPITEPDMIREVLRKIRRKYPLGWVFQLLGWNRTALAAQITLDRKLAA